MLLSAVLCCRHIGIGGISACNVLFSTGKLSLTHLMPQYNPILFNQFSPPLMICCHSLHGCPSHTVCCSSWLDSHFARLVLEIYLTVFFRYKYYCYRNSSGMNLYFIQLDVGVTDLAQWPVYLIRNEQREKKMNYLADEVHRLREKTKYLKQKRQQF